MALSIWQPIGGKKRSAYYFDLWCLKYLPKFKWDHLTEEINYQRAVREQKLAAEIEASKRERDFYLTKVDRAKAVEAIKERKGAKAEAGKEHGNDEGRGGERGRRFRQRREKPDPASSGSAPSMPTDVLKLIRPV